MTHPLAAVSPISNLRLDERLGHLRYPGLVAVVLLSCDQQARTPQSEHAEYVSRDSAGVVIHANGHWKGVPGYSTTPPRFDVGAVDSVSGADVVLAGVTGAVPVPEGVAVADNGSNAVSIFDLSGQRLRMFGGEGEGPGEFMHLSALSLLSAGKLSVFDGRLQRLTSFSLEGDEVSVTALRPALANPPLAVGTLADGVGVIVEVRFDPPESGFQKLPALIKVFTDAGVTTVLDTLTGRMGRAHVSRGSFLASPVFEPSLKATAAGSSIWVSTCEKPEAMKFDSVGTLLEIVRWRRDSPAVDQESIDTYRRNRLKGQEGTDRDEMEERLNAVPVADSFPSCDTMLALADGTLFVREFARPYDLQRKWLVFNDGRLLKTVSIQVDADVMWIDEDRTLTLERDELDVEHVRLRGIVPSSE